MAVLVDAQGVGVARPGKPLFDDLSLTISTGDRIGVVGLNGCGKSTLLRVLAGTEQPERGTVRFGRSVTVALLDQRAALPPGTVRAVAASAVAPDERWRAEAILDRLGMTPLLDADVATLSGGQAKRVSLALALLDQPDLLLLDEPTNHLDLASIGWLEDHLAERAGALVLVTHDRHVLDRVTTRAIEIDRGTAYVHEGGYASYLERRALREEQAADAESTRRVLARRELDWLRRGAPARTRKPKARIASATALVTARADAPARSGDLDLAFGTKRLGDRGVELEGVGFTHPGAAAPTLQPLDLELGRGDRLGIVGPNGAGKSTLLDLVAGRLSPTVGTVERGPTVRVGYYDQASADLPERTAVRDLVAAPHPPGWETDRLLERFWFGADTRYAPVGLLSGGERRRLQLVLVLAQQPNVLLLDEPTNDLDLDTLRVLEDALEEWPGALVVVSHDRAFLERTVVDVLALDATGEARRVPGGYAAWEAEQHLRRPRAAGPAAAAAARPVARPRARAAPERAAKKPANGRVLRDLEKEIARLERERDRLAERLGATTDHLQLAAIGTELADVTEALASAEDRWLDLA